jgi:hypothetical protein
MDRWTRLGGGIAVVLYLRSSYDQVVGDLLERRALHRRHCQRSTRQCCLGVERIRVSRRAATIFATGHVVWVLWGLGGPSRGVSGARRGLRHEGGGAGR